MKTWCVKTCKGRVVYDRKPHPFKIKDLVRIGKKVPTIVVISYEIDIVGIFRWIAAGFPDDKKPEWVCGEGFGGGGATRVFTVKSAPAEDPSIDNADGFLFVSSSIIGD